MDPQNTASAVESTHVLCQFWPQNGSLIHCWPTLFLGIELVAQCLAVGQSGAQVTVVSRKKTVNGVPSSLESEDENPDLEFELKTRRRNLKKRSPRQTQSSDWFTLFSSIENSRRENSILRSYGPRLLMSTCCSRCLSLWRSAKSRCLVPQIPETPLAMLCLAPWCFLL